MSRNDGDLRVRRTRKLLREALVELIEERDFDSLTVSDIAERAMVSRAAFYRYYRDKYDLVESLFQEMLVSVAREIDPLRKSAISRVSMHSAEQPWNALFELTPEAQHTPGAYVTMFEHVANHARLYRALLGKRGSSWFVSSMQTSLTQQLTERLPSLAVAVGSKQLAESRVMADGFVSFVLAAQLVATITWWLERGMPYTPEQVATCWYRLMCSTLKDVPTWG